MENIQVKRKKNSPQKADVSVLVTSYNYGAYILETLDSVHQQTLHSIDLIIVDDCSTDNSMNIIIDWIDKNGSRFPSYTVIQNQENMKVEESRNTGLRCVHSDYVFILDADNIIFKRCLESHLDAILTTKASFVYAMIARFGFQTRLANLISWDPSLLKRPYVDAMALFSVRDINKVGGYDKIIHSAWEDYDVYIKMAKNGMTGVQIPEILSGYRTHDEQKTSYLHKINLENEIFDFLKKKHPLFFKKETKLLVPSEAGLPSSLTSHRSSFLQGARWAVANPLKFFKKYFRRSNFLLARSVKSMGVEALKVQPHDAFWVVLNVFDARLWYCVEEALSRISVPYKLIVIGNKSDRGNELYRHIESRYNGVIIEYVSNTASDAYRFRLAYKHIKSLNGHVLKLHIVHNHDVASLCKELDILIPSGDYNAEMISHNLACGGVGLFRADTLQGVWQEGIETLSGSMFWMKRDVLDSYMSIARHMKDKKISVQSESIVGSILKALHEKEASSVEKRYGHQYVSTATYPVVEKKMKDIYVFFHLCIPVGAEYFAREFIEDLINSGVYEKSVKIYYSLAGELTCEMEEYLSSLDKMHCVYRSEDLQVVEYPILSFLENFSETHDVYVLYFHTKGVTRKHQNYRRAWRDRLIEKTLYEHERCVGALTCGFDLAGCGWKEHPDFVMTNDLPYNLGTTAHFSGNFWWSHTNYIKTLPSIEKLKKDFLSRHSINTRSSFEEYRIQCEMWVGMNGNAKVSVNGDLNVEYGKYQY